MVYMGVVGQESTKSGYHESTNFEEGLEDVQRIP